MKTSSKPQNTIRLRELKLQAMAEAYELQNQQPKLQSIAFGDRLGMLLEAETASRKSRKLNRLIKTANFLEAASLEDLDGRVARGLDKTLVAALSTYSWISRHQNLIILGAIGVGKSWLGSAFGQQACWLAMTVAFHLYQICTQL